MFTMGICHPRTVMHGNSDLGKSRGVARLFGCRMTDIDWPLSLSKISGSYTIRAGSSISELRPAITACQPIEIFEIWLHNVVGDICAKLQHGYPGCTTERVDITIHSKKWIRTVTVRKRTEFMYFYNSRSYILIVLQIVYKTKNE